MTQNVVVVLNTSLIKKTYNKLNMKTITLQLYNFDELSEEVQKEIIERERWNIMEQCMDAYSSDYRASLEAFEELTNTKANNWQVDYCGYHVNISCVNEPIYENPIYCDKDIYAESLCGKLLFRYINNNIIPQLTKGKYYSTSGKYVDGRYTCRHRRSRVILEYDGNCPLTGMCYDYYLLKPLIDYYDSWDKYPSTFSLEDLIEQCYDHFFNCWHEEYRYWADDEDAIREELHNNQYEDRLYYKDGKVYNGPLSDVA